MHDSTQQKNPLFTSSINYAIDFDGHCESNIVYGIDPALVMDIYYPKQLNKPIPAVILVTGYPDPGFEQATGMKLKEVAQYISWAKLFTSKNIAAITYANLNPEEDILTLLQFVNDNALTLGIDMEHIAIWSCSGSVPNALAVLARKPTIKCAAFLYGYMAYQHCSELVEEASKTFMFVNSKKDEALFKFPPLLIVRAGNDHMPKLNSSIDLFVSDARLRKDPVTLLNLPDAHHAFDVLCHLPSTQTAIRKILGFFQTHLTD